MKKILCIMFCMYIQFMVTPFSFIPYQSNFKAIETKRFRVLYPENKLEMAQKTAQYAEDIYDKVNGLITRKPFGRIVIIITDHTDSANGLAYVHYRNTIHLYTPSIDMIDGLRDTKDPLYSMLLHEMTHIFHLDQISGAAYFWRVMSGRLYFPVTGAFTWFHEGITVYSESRLTEGGRLDTAYTKALLQELAEKRAIPDFHRLVQPVVDWPYGESHYYLGGLFTEYLINTYGKEKYQQFNTDLSNDFWPFIYEFMIKFRKVYGKSLNNLWNEWRESEYAKVDFKKTKPQPLISTEGSLGFWGFNNDELYYSSYTSNKGGGFYKVTKEDKHVKLLPGLVDHVAFTENGFLFLKTSMYPGDKQYSDIYFMKKGTKLWKRLTIKKRVTLISYSKESKTGFFIAGNNFTVFTFNNDTLRIVEEIQQNTFSSIIDISQSGNNAVFSGRLANNKNYSIGMLNGDTKTVSVIEGITGKKPVFVNDNSFIFTGKMKNRNDTPFVYTIAEQTFFAVEKPDEYVNQCVVNDNTLYYSGLTDKGHALFKTAFTYPVASEKPLPANDDWLYYEPVDIQNPVQTKQTFYNPFAYLYPLYWYPLPQLLNSSFEIPYIGFFPYITSAITLGGFEPLGRFSYEVTVGLDYIKWYPNTSVNLQFKLPCLNVYYSFNTTKTNEFYYENYSIALFNGVSLVPYFTIDNNNLLWAEITGGIELTQNQLSDYQLSEIYQFSGEVGYSYTTQRNGSYSWNSGFSINTGISGYGDFNELYDLSLSINVLTKIPIGKHSYYINNKAGYTIFNNNSFIIGSENIMFNNVGFLPNIPGKIDFKGLSYAFHGAIRANAFIYTNTGFDITLYQRSHYWQFLTLGFKGLYFKPFNEFIITFSNTTRYMIDAGAELTVDFFAYYGNITFSINQGYALGYLFGNPLPFVNVYLYASFGL